MAKPRILVVEANGQATASLTASLSSRRGEYDLQQARSLAEAAGLLQAGSFDLVITDLELPNADALDLVRLVKDVDAAVPVIVLSSSDQTDRAVGAIQLGAQSLFIKPIDPDRLRRQIDEILSRKKNKAPGWQRARSFPDEVGGRPILGNSQKIRSILQLVKQVAPSQATVLIQGESGTGKELFAEAIHRYSRRAGGPLIKFSCASLTESIIESELFGHERGAFTGAVTQKKGLFEVANRGTLFLDEVGDMTPHTQAKLLRVLQEGEFQRVGGTVTIKVDVRVIAATNVDLAQLVAEKKFRQDLYYRLNVVTIDIPPLRERREDIPLLVEHFLAKYTTENGRPPMRLSPKALELLMRYDWPGNVRELENCIERAVVLTRGRLIEPDRLPPQILNQRDPARIVIPIGTTMEEIKKEAILRTLEAVGGNKTRAARILGIGVRTIHAKLKEYGIR